MRPEERDPAHLWDMLEATRAIMDFTQGLTLSEFLAAGRDKEITRLLLLAWLNDLFGYQRNRDLLADMKGVSEGFDDSGRRFVYHRLIALGEGVKFPADDLSRYLSSVRIMGSW